MLFADESVNVENAAFEAMYGEGERPLLSQKAQVQSVDPLSLKGLLEN